MPMSQATADCPVSTRKECTGFYATCILASIEKHNGRVVHYAGDAVLDDFGTVVDAMTSYA